ncbi:hypothetical protein OAK19_05890, partial [Aureispira]|nr:hypothetical protein [Aureispira sp.]
PFVHKNPTAPVPPRVETVAEPEESPKQFTFEEELIEAATTEGSDIVIVETAEQPRESVTVTVKGLLTNERPVAIAVD